ncbi:MAG: pyruvate dehydrogenase (acetyl-transferring) E1 component subunit alpha [Mycoplasmoidaceae bacterium]
MKKLIVLDESSSHFCQFLDNNGVMKKGINPTLDNKTAVEILKKMIIGRETNKKMLQWQRTGKMLTFAPNLGEEALQYATAYAMDKKNDWFVPAFRSFHLMVELGVEVYQLFLYWNGNEYGSKFNDGVNVLPINITIGAQLSQAAGLAYAFKVRKEKKVAITFIGDGGTSEGEFYESMNMAAIHQWPVIFCVNNNEWAISTPTRKETKVSDISSKAIAAGIHRIRVDGNDVFASYEVMLEAFQIAREKSLPVLVEFVTYRQGPHTTSDDPSIYRNKEEEAIGNEKCPIIRLRKYLISKKLWDENLENKTLEEAKGFIEREYEKMVLMNKVSINDIFNYTYETLPDDLIEQKQLAKKYFE